MAELFIFSCKGDLFSSWEITEILSQRPTSGGTSISSKAWGTGKCAVWLKGRNRTKRRRSWLWSYCVPGIICMASFTRALRRMGLIGEGRVPFYKEENFNTERLGNLSKATQPVRGMDGIWSPCAVDPKPLHMQVNATPATEPCRQSRTSFTSLIGQSRVVQGAEIEVPVSRNLILPGIFVPNSEAQFKLV